MTEELDKKLCEKYPKIFADRDADMKDTCMCWGFPGDGWYWLIDHLCLMIQNHIDNQENNNKRNEEFNLVLALAKEGHFGAFIEYYKTFSIEFIDKEILKVPTLEYREVKPVYQVVASQVKEKFGGLRFYIDGGDEVVHAYINFAEHLSYWICEHCGSTKEIGYTGGWIMTLCKTCAEKLENSSWKLAEG